MQQFRESLATILEAGIDTVRIINNINIDYDDNDSVDFIAFTIIVTTAIIIAWFI